MEKLFIQCKDFYLIRDDRHPDYKMIEDTIEMGSLNNGHVVIVDTTTGNYFISGMSIVDENYEYRPIGTYDPETDYFEFYPAQQEIKEIWKKKQES